MGDVLGFSTCPAISTMRAARLVEEEELKRTKARGARVAMRENMFEILGLFVLGFDVLGFGVVECRFYSDNAQM